MTYPDSNEVKKSNWTFVRNVCLKAAALFLLINLLFALAYPLPTLGKVSLYNTIFPGRLRLPYGENPQRAYNLSLYNLEAMFASHTLDGKPKPADEFRVIFIGDSSTWGYLLKADQTLASVINAQHAQLKDSRVIRAYNLGYPVMSLTKDLLILSYALRYQPDLIVWPVTLESFPLDKQLFPELIQNNPTAVKELIQRFNLNIEEDDVRWVEPNFLNRTIIAARRNLADLFRLQLFGFLWAATSIDQDIPENYVPRQEDLAADQSFHNLTPDQIKPNDLALDVLSAAYEMAGDIPILIVNEPIFISHGENSDIRYNFYYPHWAYDSYRQILSRISQETGWKYLDFWDAIPAEEFTNSAVHMSPKGTAQFAMRLLQAIQELAN